MIIKRIFMVFALFFFIGCSQNNIIGHGILQKREVIESEGKRPVYKVTILDYSCNCTRTFEIHFYKDFYKPQIGSEIYIIRNDLFGTQTRSN